MKENSILRTYVVEHKVISDEGDVKDFVSATPTTSITIDVNIVTLNIIALYPAGYPNPFVGNPTEKSVRATINASMGQGKSAVIGFVDACPVCSLKGNKHININNIGKALREKREVRADLFIRVRQKALENAKEGIDPFPVFATGGHLIEENALELWLDDGWIEIEGKHWHDVDGYRVAVYKLNTITESGELLHRSDEMTEDSEPLRVIIVSGGNHPSAQLRQEKSAKEDFAHYMGIIAAVLEFVRKNKGSYDEFKDKFPSIEAVKRAFDSHLGDDIKNRAESRKRNLERMKGVFEQFGIWNEVVDQTNRVEGSLWLKRTFRHLRSVEWTVDKVRGNVETFMTIICAKDGDLILKMVKVSGLMYRLGDALTSESFLNSLTNLFFGFCKKDDDDDEQPSRDVFAKLCTFAVLKSLGDEPLLFLVKVGALRRKFPEEFAGCFWSSPPHVQALRDCDLEKLEQMESFTNFDTFTWEFVIEKYKKKGFDLDGAIVAAHQRGTTAGERWTQEENDALAAAVEEHGHNWTLIAAFVAGRTAEQCSYRWYYQHAYVYAKRGPWESYEDGLLTAAVDQYGPKDWIAVAKYDGLNRSPAQCCGRWCNHLVYADAKRGEWESYEDELLKKALDQYGEGKWKKIADSTPLLNRSPLQCSNRWHNHLAYPDVERGPWKPAEDELLKKAVNQSGGEWDWKKIADSTPLLNRSPLQCSNRWHNHLVFLNVSCGEWSAEEETCLRTAVEQQEDKTKKSWKIVAGFPGVNHSWEQCRAYWRNTLLPKINMEKFQQPIMRRDDIFKERERKEREERERKERERLLINDGSDL